MPWALLARRGFEFDYEFGGYPAAVFDVDALGLGPLADLGGVQGVRLCFASAAGWLPGAGAVGRPVNRSSARGPEGACRHAITVTDAETGPFIAPVRARP